MPTLALAFDLSFEDLYTHEGLLRVDGAFLNWLLEHASEAHALLSRLRKTPIASAGPDHSDFLIHLAPHVARFVARLFGTQPLEDALETLRLLADFRRLFVIKRVLPAVKEGTCVPVYGEELAALSDEAFAREVLTSQDTAFLARAANFCAWRMANEPHNKLFSGPTPTDYDHLLDVGRRGVRLEASTLHPRAGFDLTHTSLHKTEAFLEASACLHCHKRGKDSCAKGLLDPQGMVQKNPLGEALSGCPLGQKISEMAYLKAQGQTLAALIVACLDNPLLAATGDRICTDCARACIFQKQTPIDIPALESAIFEEVLESPWGFEIYSLLTRWSPLHLTNPVPLPPSHHTVLVVGMGPSGITMAHHLLNCGHSVVALEGLKVAPLDPALLQTPIFDARKTLYKPLSQRPVMGFGGVAEYGITVRWDKNRLMVLRLLLERRRAFTLLGSTRLGSQITAQEALAMGFDHVALCLGAGAPHVPDTLSHLPRGVRTASDFLMTLHTGGAYLEETLASVTLRLPLYVLGGGLTAVDAATEALAYYPLQVTRFAKRYAALLEHHGEEGVKNLWTQDEWEEASTYLAHAHAIAQEEASARAQNRTPQILPLLSSWGGVRVLYRRSLTKAPAYRKGAYELQKALEEGIIFEDNTDLVDVIMDKDARLTGLRLTREDGFQDVEAKTLLIASGTLENNQAQGVPDPRITSHGDMDPAFRGSVVGAMASATRGARKIHETLKEHAPQSNGAHLSQTLSHDTQALVTRVLPLTKDVWEITLFAPRAARAFEPGQFFRFQGHVGGFDLEPLALTGAHVDKEKGEISLIVLAGGATSALTKFLKPGERAHLMGPTGAPTPLPWGKKVLLVGGGLGNAVLFSIGQALVSQGCQVLYVAGYRTRDHVFKKEEVEKSCTQVFWCVEEGSAPDLARPQDQSTHGSVLAALDAYIWAPESTCLEGAPDVVLTIGPAAMMEAVGGSLRDRLFEKTTMLASLNSPMQCMMKGVCGACVQPKRDADTKKRYMFFSCACQDQPLQEIDFVSLKARLAQNSVEEKLNNAWVRLGAPWIQGV